ncbi:hypothetical protein LOC67_19080 [Stieleria sp. JC731]|uniref:hypothetical protein n=1 Tax=Pirellulaceae TaxID=2691357 RepID=UPI001E4609E7|nr:hypothetical protein [Stieleria sp. JC731]MCC9602659.1 hypothetical protein [Stieleria sp. JC731]
MPNQRYFWGVAHVGKNRLQSDFSEKQEFATGELDYRLEPFELGKHFNCDVVKSPGDQTEDAFQVSSTQLLIDGFRPEGGNEKYRGLPENHRIGPHRLGEHQKPNAIQFGKHSAAIRLKLPRTKTKALRFLLASALSAYEPDGAAIEVLLEYADGTGEKRVVNCPDWTMKSDCQLPDDGVLPTNIVRHGIDRGTVAGAAFNANYALFDTMIAVDSSRELLAIVIPAKQECTRFSSEARINILAITGVVSK